MSFIVQVLWPFTIFKQPSGSWVIFESLGTLNSRFTFGGIKFCEEFRKELRSMTPTRSSEDDFFKFLERHSNTFKDFDDFSPLEIRGCLSEKNLRIDIAKYFQLATTEKPCESLLISPTIDKKEAIKSFKKLLELKNKASKDIEKLNRTKSSFESVVRKWNARIDERIEWVRDHYDSEIAEITPDVIEKVENLEKDRDRETASLKHSIDILEGQLRLLEQVEADLESKELEAKAELAEAREELDLLYTQEDAYTDATNTRISLLEKKIQRLNKKLARTREGKEEASKKTYAQERILAEKREELDDIRRKYVSLIDAEWYRLRFLEELRDKRLVELYAELRRIRKKSREIRQDIDTLANRKRAFISEIDGQEMKIVNPFLKPEEEIYVCVPIFVARLQSETGMRFVVFPPSRMKRGKRFFEKAGESLLGKAPIPTEPRSQSIEKLCRLFESFVKTNHLTIKGPLESAFRNNLLKSSQIKDYFLKGIEKLRNERWLKEKHAIELKKAFSHHFSRKPEFVSSAKSGEILSAKEKLPEGVWCVCSKCGAYISAKIEYCPCGAKLPQRPTKG